MKLSEASKAIMDMVKHEEGEREFDADQASVLWGGSEGAVLADLTPGQLLQYALIKSHANVHELLGIIEEMVESEQVMAVLNREQRRRLEKATKPTLVIPGH